MLEQKLTPKDVSNAFKELNDMSKSNLTEIEKILLILCSQFPNNYDLGREIRKIVTNNLK